MKYLSILLVVLMASACRPAGPSTDQSTDDRAPGFGDTYQNPLMEGQMRMGDPFVLKTGDQYFLYGTNAAGKGFKTWRSGDLVDWEEVGFVYEKTDTSYGKSNFWAPEVFYYPPHERFYLVFTAKNNDDTGLTLCLARSERPEGPFQDVYTPWLEVDGWQRIDGHIFVDDDDTPYLYFDKVGVVGKPWEKPSTGYLYGLIYGVELTPDLSQMVGEPVLCIQADQDWENPESMHSRCNEGSYVFNKEGKYYMTYSANHYADPSYGIGYATAGHPLGPWVKNPDNPLVATDSSIQFSGPGHNSFAVSPGGDELFMVYHTHAYWDKPSGDRTVNIDRVRITGDGKLEMIGPSRSPQQAPE